MRSLVLLVAPAVAAALVTLMLIGSPPPLMSGSAPAPATMAPSEPTSPTLPLAFEENQGQTNPEARFLVHGPGYAAFFTPEEVGLKLAGADDRQAALHLRFADANPWPSIDGVDELPGKVNYFVGNDPRLWQRAISTYRQVHYRDLYPGIDVGFTTEASQLEFNLRVAPGADPTSVGFDMDGTDGIHVTESGDADIQTPTGVVRLGRPMAYQSIDGTRRSVPVRYVQPAPSELGFDLAAYDTTQPLVIDPPLVYSSYLGGSGVPSGDGDYGWDLALDDSGNAYVTGYTLSADFPTTAGAFQSCCNTDAGKAFVARFDPSASGQAQLVYSTYLGGTGGDIGGYGIAVDHNGDAFVTGGTQSVDFPTTSGAVQSQSNGPMQAFVVELDATGSALEYSTYLGGNGSDQGRDLALDGNNNVYLTGNTSSTTFPTTGSAFQRNGNANGTAFLTELNPSASGDAQLVYSTYLGGSGITLSLPNSPAVGYGDQGSALALDGAGHAFVAGRAFSTDFPTTGGAYQTTNHGSPNAFVAELDPSANGSSSLLFSTYLGGSIYDVASGITLDPSGMPSVIGSTYSADFPTTSNAYQTANGPNGNAKAFVARLNPSASGSGQLTYATFLGGSGFDVGDGITADARGNLHLTGVTYSTDFPVTRDAQQQSANANGDAYLAILNPNASGSAQLLYSSYLGGAGLDEGIRIALDARGNDYLTGYTQSTDFPVTGGAYQTSSNGNAKVFLSILSTSVRTPPGRPTDRRSRGRTR